MFHDGQLHLWRSGCPRPHQSDKNWYRRLSQSVELNEVVHGSMQPLICQTEELRRKPGLTISASVLSLTLLDGTNAVLPWTVRWFYEMCQELGRVSIFNTRQVFVSLSPYGYGLMTAGV